MTKTEREMMITAGLSENNFISPGAVPRDEYAVMVERLIRERYSISDELAILRQRDTKPDEFAEYNAFCEECKEKARASTANKGV